MSPDSATSVNVPTENLVTGSHETVGQVRPYSQSQYPAYALSSLFAISTLIPYTVLPRHTHIAPFLQRVAFAAVFGGSGYAIASGDVRNGSGIASAWSLTYLFLHLRQSFKSPRNPLSILMAGGAAASAGIYGTEYFIFQT
ncbi:hypothetical protein FIBSPDRAFT_788223 [Athelia psychrophila]|uniref:Uncharacterized protein n=1 Tax=Athelia psychrophila TaxID=1759441 RepID=A0A166K855_9AGAM|nr:hypothetical protein FIBSPDRAFT_788223 [Fibularhizoctonia sp. CBS 109695]